MTEIAPAHDPRIVYRAYRTASRKFILKWHRGASKQELMRDPIYLAELKKIVDRWNAMTPEKRNTPKRKAEVKTALMGLIFPYTYSVTEPS